MKPVGDKQARLAEKRRIDTERAEKRRAAVRAVMQQTGWTAAEWCERAKLKNANALGNFLNGIVRSLSLATLEPLAQAAGVSVSVLIGDETSSTEQKPAPEGSSCITITIDGGKELHFKRTVTAPFAAHVIKSLLDGDEAVPSASADQPRQLPRRQQRG